MTGIGIKFNFPRRRFRLCHRRVRRIVQLRLTSKPGMERVKDNQTKTLRWHTEREFR
jgi:hypothetical protein